MDNPWKYIEHARTYKEMKGTQRTFAETQSKSIGTQQETKTGKEILGNTWKLKKNMNIYI